MILQWVKVALGKRLFFAAIATGLADKGKKVHLATTDPAAIYNL